MGGAASADTTFVDLRLEPFAQIVVREELLPLTREFRSPECGDLALSLLAVGVGGLASDILA